MVKLSENTSFETGCWSENNLWKQKAYNYVLFLTNFLLSFSSKKQIILNECNWCQLHWMHLESSPSLVYSKTVKQAQNDWLCKTKQMLKFCIFKRGKVKPKHQVYPPSGARICETCNQSQFRKQHLFHCFFSHETAVENTTSLKKKQAKNPKKTPTC